VYPDDDAAAFNGSWTSYPFFASGSVAVNGIEQGLFVLRPRAEPRGQPTGLTVTIGEPGDPFETDREWDYMVTVSNHGPGSLRDVRLIDATPTGARLISARPTLGRCEVGASATCDLGDLAAGSDAFVIVTVRAAGEREFLTTATVIARAADGGVREASAMATTRGMRFEPRLDLRRPSAGTVFRLGRNNTVQWTLAGVAGGVRIELSRDDGASWARLIDDAPNTGFFDWAPAGATTPRARLRVTSLARPNLTRVSPSF
jgi:hypothetical protein